MKSEMFRSAQLDNSLNRQLEFALQRSTTHRRAGRDVDLEFKARALLRQLGANKLAREVRVEWNSRLKTCAGRADFRKKLISLNPLLLDVRARHGTSPSDWGTGLTANGDEIAHATDARGKLDCLKQSSLTSADNRDRFKRSVSDASCENIYDEIDRTLRHELAHLLAQWRVGRRRIAPHGIEWRQACRDLGIADEARCHNLPFATKVCVRRYVYVCPNCKEKFPRVRRIRRAIACLACCRKLNGGDFDPRFRLKLTTTL
jgi:predicted SprT family Zn-dependent metalloprotease